MMHRINVGFDEKQIKRLLKGHVVQVSASQLQKSSTTPILVNNKQFSTYKRSIKLNKGMRFQIAPELMNDNHMILGGGIKDLWKSAKKTVKSVSKKVYDEAIKPTGKKIKDSAKAGAKAFAMDALGSDNIRGYAKDNAKKRALEWAKNDALDIVHAGINEGIVIGEKELEDALINNHNFDPDLARQMISAGSHRLSQKAYDELMNIDDALNEELMNVAEGAGLKPGVHYTVTKGGKLSFKGFLRGLRKVAKKVLTVGRPVLKPLASLAGQTAGAFIGGPTGAKIGATIADGGYDALQQGLGMRPIGKSMHVMPVKKRVVVKGSGSKRGSAEMKARMAKVRASKKSGGALKPAGYGRGLSPAGYY